MTGTERHLPEMNCFSVEVMDIAFHVPPIKWKGDILGHIGIKDVFFYVLSGECYMKIEDDFLSYKFNKFVELLHEYELVSDEEYNFTTYGTEDEIEIRLVKQGLPIHLVSKLTTDQQLTNLTFDENNIVHCNEDFVKYYQTLDDFYQYQIDKYVYVQ